MMRHFDRDPLLCILPPYMLRNLYANTPAARQRDMLDCIVDMARLRGRREAIANAPHATVAADVGGKNRRVYSADNGSALPGRLIRSEGDAPSTDVAVNEAYDGAGLTYDLYWRAYERDSLDGKGMPLNSTVHYQKAYDNAFWDGQRMVYGDGDDDLFNRFTVAVDVIGHELTHGVTQYTCNLTYRGQSGALNESLSDVFGSLVKQWQRGDAASDADWLIGQGLFTPKVNGAALRSMKDPGTAYDDPILGKDPQPGHMRDYAVTLEDAGGVHINSGIPNHAFFLAAVAMGGYAWERAGRVWYIAARDRFTTGTDFQGAAKITHAVAGALYGEGSDEQKAVQYGWESVGIQITAAGPSQPPSLPSGCLSVPVSAVRGLWSRLRITPSGRPPS
jgi:Zn-dependent metalloprotease